MNLADEFALLAHRDDGSPETDGTRLDRGLAGALLLELALAERIGVEGNKVVVRDPSPTGDRLVDDALTRIAADERGRKPGEWVAALARDVRVRTLDGLVEAGVLTKEQSKVLLVFDVTRYPATERVEPAAETEARQRLVAAVSGQGPVEPRTAALCSLLAATGLDRKVFAGLDRKRVQARLKEISEGAWAAAAVKKTIEEIEAVMLITVVAAAT